MKHLVILESPKQKGGKLPSKLEMKGVSLSLRSKNALVIKDISLSIERGKTAVLLGASGSGKSLSLSVLQGLIPENLKLASGQVLLDGAPLDSTKARGRIFSSILQNPRTCFNPLFSLASHFRETLAALGMPYSRENIEAMLGEVGLSADALSLYPFELSGGMLQRVMIAIALLSGASFLIADEPTSDLDFANKQRLLDLLNALQTKRNLGLLIVTHDLDLAAKAANRIYLMHAGELRGTLCVDPLKRGELKADLIQKLSSMEEEACY